jgi:hypothetical protein
MANNGPSTNNFVSNTAIDGDIAGMPVVPGQVIYQGDVLCWDATLNSALGAVRSVTNQADMATYIGISEQQSPVASLGDTINNVNIYKQAKMKFYTNPGDVFKMWVPVYFLETASNAQTVTTSTNSGARTVPVGYCVLTQQLVGAGVLSYTGVAGQFIHVVITPNYPFAVKTY